MFCHNCGSQVDDDAQFCTHCGRALSKSVVFPEGPAPNSIWTPPTQVHASAGRWLAAGWELVTADLGNYLLISLIFFLLNGVPFIQGALIAGFHIYTMKKLMRRPVGVGDIFEGFNYFIPTLIASILIGIFTFIGFLLLIIPGLIVASMYKFTYLFIVDKKMGFWEAMQASHAVVRQDYFGFVMFLVLVFLVNVMGFCCLFVGLLVTVPMTFAAITVAYSEIVGFDRRAVDAL